jgi:FkbM family methyltransferase
MQDFERLLEQFYEVLLEPGSVALDIGAHVGRHTLPIARLVLPDGKVYAFEPLEQCRQQLGQELAEEPQIRESVTILPYALSNISGEADFVMAKGALGYSGLRERRYDVPVETETVKVQVRKIDDVCQNWTRLDYIKLDAEGGEFHIIEGGQRILRRLRPTLSFEFGVNSLSEYNVTPQMMSELLRSLDYDTYDIHGSRLSTKMFDKSAREQRLWDYIAIPQNHPERDKLVSGLQERNALSQPSKGKEGSSFW